jgi:hypothetical protein
MYQSVSMQFGFGMGGIMNERSIGLLAFPAAEDTSQEEICLLID